MATGIRALLMSLQLSDSPFPSDVSMMSHGLGGLSQARLVDHGGVVGSRRGLRLHGVGPGDATAIARAHEATAEGDGEQVHRGRSGCCPRPRPAPGCARCRCAAGAG